MMILHLARPKFSIQGFLAVLAVLAGWAMVLLARQDIPRTITLLQWQPAIFFPNSPSLLIDDISWYFSLSLITLALSSIVSSIAHSGESHQPEPNLNDKKIDVIEVQEQPEGKKPPSKPIIVSENKSRANWQAWAGILVLTSLGLVAVTAGNILTLLLAWAALDILELFIVLDQVLESKSRERIILAFSIRVAAIGVVILAGIDAWSNGMLLSFNDIDQITSIYLILAAGLRFGVLPIQLPFIDKLPQKREFGTILQLVPAAASLILIVRVANIGILGVISPFLLGFTALIGFYAGIQWLNSKDEIKGMRYWVFGTASLAIASAILNNPSASIAWSIGSLLSGGLIFLMFIHHKNLIPIAFLGFISFSALPFSPTWLGTKLYTSGMSSTTITPFLFFLFSLLFLLTHSLLLAGFIRHILRGIYPHEQPNNDHIERWVWLLFPVGLIFILITHFLIGVLLYPKLNEIHLTGWIMGVVAVIFSGAIWYFYMRYLPSSAHRDQSTTTSPLSKFLSLEWLFRFFGSLFHSLSRFVALISTILEGDGGILWAFVLFALIIVFLLR